MQSKQDIVERIRLSSPYIDGIALHNLIRDAAATIEVLRAEVRAWRKFDGDAEEHDYVQSWDSNREHLHRVQFDTDAAGALGKEGSNGQ